MKKMIAGFIALAFTLSAFAQQNSYNDPNAAVRNVSGFTGIKVANGIDLMITQGNTEAVAVSAAQPEDREKIKTEVDNGVLRIYFDNGNSNRGWRGNNKKLKAYVSVVTLNLLYASSGAGVKIDGTVKAGQLKVELSSGASLQGNINATGMDVNQSSGSSSRLSGTAQTLHVEASSGAHFRGFDIAVDNCNAGVNSGGKVEITVNKELEANASSGGAVQYKGGCSIRKTHTSSGGSVTNKA